MISRPRLLIFNVLEDHGVFVNCEVTTSYPEFLMMLVDALKQELKAKTREELKVQRANSRWIPSCRSNSEALNACLPHHCAGSSISICLAHSSM